LIAPARKGALKHEVRRECGESRFRSVERGKAPAAPPPWAHALR
jgi:hypothetical protein